MRSSLHLFARGTGRPIIRAGGAPVIAVDTKRNRAAVPFVDRDLVEIWQLPSKVTITGRRAPFSPTTAAFSWSG